MSELPVTIEGYLADVRGIDTWGAGSIMALAEIIIVGTSEAQGVVPAAQVAAPASVPVAATATVKVATVGSTALRGEGTLATVKVATSGTATVEFSGDGATNRKGFPYHFPIVFGADNFRMWTSGPADAGITSTANAGVALIASMWSRIEAPAGVVVSVDANADIVFEAPQWSSGVFPFTFPIKFYPKRIDSIGPATIVLNGVSHASAVVDAAADVTVTATAGVDSPPVFPLRFPTRFRP